MRSIFESVGYGHREALRAQEPHPMGNLEWGFCVFWIDRKLLLDCSIRLVADSMKMWDANRSGWATSSKAKTREAEPTRFNKCPPIVNHGFGGFKMPFGKHKGKRINTIPVSYLEWFIKLDSITYIQRMSVERYLKQIAEQAPDSKWAE